MKQTNLITILFTTVLTILLITGSAFGTSDDALVVDENGNVGIGTNSPSQKLHVDGNINVTGGQIIFPATQSVSSDSHTLDDYEEGIWIPVISDGTNNPNVA